MRTNLHPDVLATEDGLRAQQILRNCVHCGFCTATCPTYLETGNELDGPRGRINLMNLILEENKDSRVALHHLDRCLTCQSCETTCPSDVAYGELLQITRTHFASSEKRPLHLRLLRRLLTKCMALIWPGALGYWLLLRLRRLINSQGWPPEPAPVARYRRAPEKKAVALTLLLLPGCVQSYTSPDTVAAAAAVLSFLGCQVKVAPASCCGALHQHAGYTDEAQQLEKRNLSLWSGYDPDVVVSLASGCGAHIKSYNPERLGRLQVKAIEEVIKMFDISRLPPVPKPIKVAWQIPCTLQHSQRIDGKQVLSALTGVGYQAMSAPDAHLCCGSAGIYSLEQWQMAAALRRKKLAALMTLHPDVIATANIGCQLHLGSKADVPVRHWISLLAEGLKVT